VLRAAGLDTVWRGDHYASEHRTLISCASTYHTRAVRAPTSAVQAAEARLQWSLRTNGWLTLAADLGDTDRVATALVERFGVTEVNLTRVLLDAMRRVAAERGADWRVVVAADVPDHPHRRNLDRLAGLARPAMVAAVDAHTGPLLLVDAAPLARYGLLDVLVRMADEGSRPAARWLLVPWRQTELAPSLDGVPVPTGGTAFLPIPRDWPANQPVEVA